MSKHLVTFMTSLPPQRSHVIVVDVLLEVFFVFVFFLYFSHIHYLGFTACVFALRCLLIWQVNHHDSRGKDGCFFRLLEIPEH